MTIATELQGIYDRRGTLTPALVVDEARQESHPLHTAFEWDDTVAGERYRQVQAAQLIRSVRVKYGKRRDGTDKTVRQFVSVMPDDQPDRAYQPVEQVMDDPFSRELLLREARREWMRFKQKYQSLAEFAAIISDDREATG